MRTGLYPQSLQRAGSSRRNTERTSGDQLQRRLWANSSMREAIRVTPDAPGIPAAAECERAYREATFNDSRSAETGWSKTGTGGEPMRIIQQNGLNPSVCPPHTFPDCSLLGGFCGRCASLRSRSRRLKAGGSQDWLPHDLCRMGARIKKYAP